VGCVILTGIFAFHWLNATHHHQRVAACNPRIGATIWNAVRRAAVLGRRYLDGLVKGAGRGRPAYAWVMPMAGKGTAVA